MKAERACEVRHWLKVRHNKFEVRLFCALQQHRENWMSPVCLTHSEWWWYVIEFDLCLMIVFLWIVWRRHTRWRVSTTRMIYQSLCVACVNMFGQHYNHVWLAILMHAFWAPCWQLPIYHLNIFVAVVYLHAGLVNIKQNLNNAKHFYSYVILYEHSKAVWWAHCWVLEHDLGGGGLLE